RLYQGAGASCCCRCRCAWLFSLVAAGQSRVGRRLCQPLWNRLRRLRDAEACSQGVLRLVCGVDPSAAEMIEGWVTRDATSLLKPLQPVAFCRSLPQEALPTSEVDDSRTFQPIEGLGFALTGGSAYLLAGLAAADRANLLQGRFGLDTESGRRE